MFAIVAEEAVQFAWKRYVRWRLMDVKLTMK
jgi:hypothetical protein